MKIKIDKVELQKKDNTRFNLYSQGEYIMSASVENLAPYGYSEFEITIEELNELEAKEQRNLAYKVASRYASRSMKTTKEVRDYLRRRDIDDHIQDEIIEYLEDLGVLDDQRYLELYLEDRYNLYSDGQYKIKQKLYQKGFSSDQVDPLLEGYEEVEKENLRQLVEERTRSRPGEDKNKLMRYLVNKGYSYGMIKDELDIIDEY